MSVFFLFFIITKITPTFLLGRKKMNKNNHQLSTPLYKIFELIIVQITPRIIFLNVIDIF